MISAVGPGVAFAVHSFAVGGGNVSDWVLANGSRIPMRMERAKLKRRLIGWYVILKEKSQKARARTDARAGDVEIRAVETSFAGVSRIVALVAQPGHAKLRHQRRLFE